MKVLIIVLCSVFLLALIGSFIYLLERKWWKAKKGLGAGKHKIILEDWHVDSEKGWVWFTINVSGKTFVNCLPFGKNSDDSNVYLELSGSRFLKSKILLPEVVFIQIEARRAEIRLPIVVEP